jgi:hypothetical protein
MRPAFIGFALVWILVTFVTSFRMLVNAPVFFMIFLVPPVLVLLYGLLGEAPVPAAAEETGKTPPGGT